MLLRLSCATVPECAAPPARRSNDNEARGHAQLRMQGLRYSQIASVQTIGIKKGSSETSRHIFSDISLRRESLRLYLGRKTTIPAMGKRNRSISKSPEPPSGAIPKMRSMKSVDILLSLPQLFQIKDDLSRRNLKCVVAKRF
jgi:hypothetical protein